MDFLLGQGIKTLTSGITNTVSSLFNKPKTPTPAVPSVYTAPKPAVSGAIAVAPTSKNALVLTAPKSQPVVAPAPKPQDTITSNNIKSSGAPISMPPASNAALRDLTVKNETFIEEINQRNSQPQLSPRDQALQRILGLSGELGDRSGRTFDIQEEAGVFEKQKLVKDLENQAMARARAYDKAIEAARKNPDGKLARGVEIEMNDLQRQKNSELADIAIQQKVANDDYAGAYAIAEAKVAAEFEPLQAEIDALKTYYQLSADDMTTSEKLLAQEQIDNRQRQLDLEADKALKSYSNSITGAIPGVAGGATAPSDPVVAGYVQQVQSGRMSLAEVPAAGGIRNSVVSWFNQSGTSVPRQLGAEAQKAAINANDGLLNVQTLQRNVFNSDGTINRAALVAGSTAGVGFPIGTTATAINSIVDVLARIRTGAALTTSEEAFYKKQLPGAFDTDAQIRQKVQNLTALFAGVSGTSITLQSPDGMLFTADDMFNPDVRQQVRQALGEGYQIYSY